MDDFQVPDLRNDDFDAIMKPNFELPSVNRGVENVTHAQPSPMPTVLPSGHPPATTEINGDLAKGSKPHFPTEQQVAASSDVLNAMYEGGLDLQNVTLTHQTVDVHGDHHQNEDSNLMSTTGNVLTVNTGYLNSNVNIRSNEFETSGSLREGIGHNVSYGTSIDPRNGPVFEPVQEQNVSAMDVESGNDGIGSYDGVAGGDVDQSGSGGGLEDRSNLYLVEPFTDEPGVDVGASGNARQLHVRNTAERSEGNKSSQNETAHVLMARTARAHRLTIMKHRRSLRRGDREIGADPEVEPNQDAVAAALNMRRIKNRGAVQRCRDKKKERMRELEIECELYRYEHDLIDSRLGQHIDAMHAEAKAAGLDDSFVAGFLEIKKLFDFRYEDKTLTQDNDQE